MVLLLRHPPQIFNQMKEGIDNATISYYHGDVFNHINRLSLPINFVSFSDIPSYFPKQLGMDYLQMIKNNLASNAITVHRYYFHITKNIDIAGYQKITKNYIDLIKKEKTQIYLIDIYQRESSEQ